MPPKQRKKKKKKKKKETKDEGDLPPRQEVFAPGGPPVCIYNVKDGPNAKFVQDLVASGKRSGEKDPVVSQKGQNLEIKISTAKNFPKVAKSAKFLFSTYYRDQSAIGLKLFNSAVSAHAGKLNWKENARQMKAEVLHQLGVESEADMFKLLMSPPHAETASMNIIIIQMLTNPDLPGINFCLLLARVYYFTHTPFTGYIIELIAKGFNPMAAVRKTVMIGPFEELEVTGGGKVQDQCKKCLQPGPFSHKGLCLVCHKKRQAGPSLADLARMGTIRF
jgi:hypothetical protein